MSLNQRTCLIVEDLKESAEFTKRVVHIAFPEISIEIARNFKEAQQWLSKRESNKEKKPLGLALVDLGLPDGNGIDIIHSISKLEPEALPIVMTMYNDDAFLFKALSAGAKGYLLKGDPLLALADTLKRIETNEPPLSPAIARKLLSHFTEPKVTQQDEVRLSPREHETLILLSRGLTVAETSKQLGLSPQTVAGYVKIIYQKLHVSNRVELVQEAHRRKLI